MTVVPLFTTSGTIATSWPNTNNAAVIWGHIGNILTSCASGTTLSSYTHQYIAGVANGWLLTTTNAQAVWHQWPAGGFGSDVLIGAPAIISSRTRRRMQREQRAYDRAIEAQQRAHVEAQQRARDLLASSLTGEQRESLAARGYFDIAIGGARYRIHQGTHGNVRLLGEGDREVASFCAQPDGVPAEDAMLAQKLMLETDERAFLAVANRRALR